MTLFDIIMSALFDIIGWCTVACGLWLFVDSSADLIRSTREMEKMGRGR